MGEASTVLGTPRFASTARLSFLEDPAPRYSSAATYSLSDLGIA